MDIHKNALQCTTPKVQPGHIVFALHTVSLGLSLKDMWMIPLGQSWLGLVKNLRQKTRIFLRKTSITQDIGKLPETYNALQNILLAVC